MFLTISLEKVDIWWNVKVCVLHNFSRVDSIPESKLMDVRANAEVGKITKNTLESLPYWVTHQQTIHIRTRNTMWKWQSQMMNSTHTSLFSLVEGSCLYAHAACSGRACDSGNVGYMDHPHEIRLEQWYDISFLKLHYRVTACIPTVTSRYQPVIHSTINLSKCEPIQSNISEQGRICWSSRITWCCTITNEYWFGILMWLCSSQRAS